MSKKKFQKIILDYYKANKRSFPWRRTTDPYSILVSEIMLQQTQADRVIGKYLNWLNHFPTVDSLATAPFEKVLKQWQGLGYNRRALALKKTAIIISKKYAGTFPDTYQELLELPGIGPYTAGAIMAFAFNKAVPIIETNIRTVYLYYFYPNIRKVHDKDIMKHIEQTLDKQNPRNWYHALMDYGAMLKKTVGNLNKHSVHYTKQSTFKGSNREIRSAILKIIHAYAPTPINSMTLIKNLKKTHSNVLQDQLVKNISDLQKEGFIKQLKNKFKIAS